MDNLNLISNFAEFKELKNIDKSTMIGVLEDVFRHALQKQYETDENFDVIINPEKGDLEIWRNRTVVEDGAVEDPNAQIAVSEVKAIDPTYEIGDEYADEIKLSSFGRRAVLSLRQNLASRILDLEKASLYEKYSEKVGEIVTGEVYQVWKKEVLILDDEENELILPEGGADPQRLLPQGRYHQGHRQVGRDEQQPAPHHSFAYCQPVPRTAVRAGGSRNFRRPDHHQEDRPHPRRTRQGRRGVLRRAHRPGRRLRRHEGFAHLFDRQGAAQREHRRGELHGQPDADDPACAESRQDFVASPSTRRR